MKPTNVVVSLKASSMEELIAKQLLNNSLNGNVHYNYFQVDKKEGEYEIFFFADVTAWTDPDSLTSEELGLLNV